MVAGVDHHDLIGVGVGSVPHGQSSQPGLYAVNGNDGATVGLVVGVGLKELDEGDVIFNGCRTLLAILVSDVGRAVRRSGVDFFTAEMTVVLGIATVEGEAEGSLPNPVHQLFFREVGYITLTTDAVGLQNLNGFGMMELHTDGFHNVHGGFMKLLHSFGLVIHIYSPLLI